MSYFKKYIEVINSKLKSIVCTDSKGNYIDIQQALDMWMSLSFSAKSNNKTHYFIGNGASATMASHMALDCSKNASLKSFALNDIATLTAVGNDLGNDNLFAAPLGWYCESGDVLVSISSSGNSPNIVSGIHTAKKKNTKIITLTGMKEDNKVRKLGDINFYVPANSYGIVECNHQIILHGWLDEMMNIKEWEKT